MPATIDHRSRSWLAGAIVLLAGGRAAWGNGAFPDSVGLLVPPDRPDEITISTNFGLITSEDGGKTWTWTCEQEIASLASLYQLGPAPRDRLYTLSEHGLIRSDDLSCTWAAAGGMDAVALLTDFFPDPIDPTRLLVIGLPNSTQITGKRVYQSIDGGQSIGRSLYEAPVLDDVTGVENARVDPRIIYVASYDASGPHPKLIKSTDGGDRWAAPLDLEPFIGPNTFRIIAVDPADPQTIFLLVMQRQAQALAISTDGGATFTTPVQFESGALTAFARLASGTILAAGLAGDADGNTTGVGFRSSDGGKTFAPWTVPRLRALAERDGKLYGAADNAGDGFALGVSTDEGMTFRPLMKYSDVSGVRPCALSECVASCRMIANLGVWPDTVCDAVAPQPSASPAASPQSHSGGGCTLAGARTATSAWLLGLWAALVIRSRARRN